MVFQIALINVRYVSKWTTVDVTNLLRNIVIKLTFEYCPKMRSILIDFKLGHIQIIFITGTLVAVEQHAKENPKSQILWENVLDIS